MILIIMPKFAWSHRTCNLPDGCKFEDMYINDPIKITLIRRYFVCDRLDIKFAYNLNLSLLYSGEKDKCLERDELTVHMKTSSPVILDSSFDIEGLLDLPSELMINDSSGFSSNLKLILILILKNIKGFEINLYEMRPKNPLKTEISRDMTLYDSELEFYSKNKRIESCEEYFSLLETSKNMVNILQLKVNKLKLERVSFRTPICPLALNNSFISSLLLVGLINTFYKVNTLKFIATNVSFNIYIESIELQDAEKVTIDKEFLNREVFKNLENIHFNGELKEIQANLFSPQNFPSLRYIDIHFQFFRLLVHRQGIDWIQAINNDVYIDLNNISNLSVSDKKKTFKIFLMHNSEIETIDLFQHSDVNFYFPDEDFCLYSKFPFHQLVFISIIRTGNFFVLNNCSCTLAWVIQFEFQMPYSSLVNEYLVYHLKSIINATLKRCNFTKLISTCNKKTIDFSDSESSIYDIKDRMVIWQFVSTILSPIFSFLGILSNILVVIVTTSKKNEKALKEKQYMYIRLKSIINSLILLVQTLGLMNECQSNNGFYCSSIRKLIGIQYFKIIFTEFLCNYLRFISNLFHIAFAVNRLSLIGKEHSKFTYFLSTIKVKYFTILIFIIGLFVTFIKGLKFRANFYFEEWEYPFLYDDHPEVNVIFFKCFIAIFSSFCDLINGLGFFIICFIIDVQLVIALKRTTAEKLAKLGNMQKSKENSKAKATEKSLKNAVQRTILMVVLNSLVNSLLKIPSSLVSIYEAAWFFLQYEHIIQEPLAISHSNPLYSGIVKCHYLNICQAIREFFTFLFILSVSFDIFFYYNFDKKFKLAFFAAFSLKEKANNKK